LSLTEQVTRVAPIAKFDPDAGRHSGDPATPLIVSVAVAASYDTAAPPGFGVAALTVPLVVTVGASRSIFTVSVTLVVPPALVAEHVNETPGVSDDTVTGSQPVVVAADWGSVTVHTI